VRSLPVHQRRQTSHHQMHKLLLLTPFSPWVRYAFYLVGG